MVIEGQRIYRQNKKNDGKLYYDIGIVVERYDQVFIAKYDDTFTSCRYDEIKKKLSDDEEGIMLLTKEEKPVIDNEAYNEYLKDKNKYKGWC